MKSVWVDVGGVVVDLTGCLVILCLCLLRGVSVFFHILKD